MAKTPVADPKGAFGILTPPAEFPFPFTPYTIQHEFMHALYQALENGELGIFESPTGTGKSLSLICGALCWLRDHEAQKREHLDSMLKELQITAEGGGGGDDQSDPFSWLNEQAEQVQARQQKIKIKHELDALLAHDEKLSKIKLASQQRKDKRHYMQELQKKQFSEKTSSNKVNKQKSDNTLTLKDTCDDEDGCGDDELILDDIDEMNQDEKSDGEDEMTEEELNTTKIFFCSRTHSQLAQFVGEVQRSPFKNEISLVPLASRQNYCINEAVQRLKNVTLINEKCLDFQRKKSSKTTAFSGDGAVTKKARKSIGSSSCPALNQRNIEMLSEDTLAEVQDVEQIVAAGKKLNACPYYSSRSAVSNAQVVVLPYNTLLHKATRKACGIHLKNSIVIIDEAHNLLEAIGNIHSAQVYGHQLAHAHSQLVQYRDRYEARFSATNLLHLNQVIFVVGKLIRVLGGKPGCDPSECISKVLDTKLHTLPDFVLSSEIDNLNLFKLLNFCHHSKLSQKLHGFSERYQASVQIHKPATKVGGIRAFLKEIENSDNTAPAQKDDELTVKAEESSHGKSNNPFLIVMAFLETLTNDSADGRILVKVEPTVGKGYLKFLLLNPAAHFREIVREARAVIVAGGTMQPISEFRDQLFASAGGDVERITHFSCDHVIPPENILPIALGCGPTGKFFDFSFNERNSSVVINELGRLLVNICNVVPGGVVCFFPSYDYEKHVFGSFEKSGIITQLQNKKKIFREPKKASDVDAVLLDYASCIRKAQGKDTKLSGSLLFSVIGGKLSEGLNFSDDLGRCIIVVGLPYPNIKSAELQEQMKFIDANVGSGAGQRHYENLCMKAVNQSIGRAVRHKDDYATVLLLDRRYLQSSRQNALPNWIKKSLQSEERFGAAFRLLCQFFQMRRVKPKTSVPSSKKE